MSNRRRHLSPVPARPAARIGADDINRYHVVHIGPPLHAREHFHVHGVWRTDKETEARHLAEILHEHGVRHDRDQMVTITDQHLGRIVSERRWPVGEQTELFGGTS